MHSEQVDGVKLIKLTLTGWVNLSVSLSYPAQLLETYQKGLD